LEDTIAAIATPPGVGGIGIIRVSGPKSRDLLRLLFKSAKGIGDLRSHHLYHGDIISPETGAVIDEVLVCLMKKPHSYTGEDVLEINCHGGPVILQTVLTEIVKAGARLAEPGEFTRRAFLNNRIDLSQAEAVLDIITARSDRGLELAVSHLKGTLAKKIETLRSTIIDVLALLEASIDFSDEDIEVCKPLEIADTLKATLDELQHLLSTYREGKILREGISAVITGKPNVGKSSLLNRLLGEKRAIVTPIPGTTRDFIEETVTIRGVPVKLTDTAGIREPENLIEREGIDFVREKLSGADIMLIVLDGSEKLSGEDHDILNRAGTKRCLIIINKTDLPHRLNETRLQTLLGKTAPQPLWISAKYGDGIDNLKDAIYSLAMDTPEHHHSEHIISNIRHKTALEKTSVLLSRARESILNGVSPEFASFDIREALDSLGEITGKTINEEVLDRIFSTFCIGK